MVGFGTDQAVRHTFFVSAGLYTLHDLLKDEVRRVGHAERKPHLVVVVEIASKNVGTYAVPDRSG